MKITISTFLVAITIVFASNSIFADSIVAPYTCKLKEGKKLEELQAVNSNWLKWVRKNVNEEGLKPFSMKLTSTEAVYCVNFSRFPVRLP